MDGMPTLFHFSLVDYPFLIGMYKSNVKMTLSTLLSSVRCSSNH